MISELFLILRILQLVEAFQLRYDWSRSEHHTSLIFEPSQPTAHPFIMLSHIVSAETPLPPVMLQEIAADSPLDEISNTAGAVRSHIFWNDERDSVTGKLRKSMFFFVYQTTRHGPKNRCRLCLVHRGFYTAYESKVEGDPEDDIDRLEAVIPQGHMEVAVLGDVADGQDAARD